MPPDPSIGFNGHRYSNLFDEGASLASLRDLLFYFTRESRRRKPLQHIEDWIIDFHLDLQFMQENEICIPIFTHCFKLERKQLR